MNFLKPQFRFLLHLLESEKTYPKNQNKAWCNADGYDIKEDGSITFYQIMVSPDKKKIKVPVLSYPNGKWEACVLVDYQNDFPVFNLKSGFFRQSSGGSAVTTDSGKPNTDSKLSENQEEPEEMTGLDEMFGTNILGSNSQQGGHGFTMPGVNNINPQEFKKQKDVWMETEIKSYIKTVDAFDANGFLKYLKSTSAAQFKQYKPAESEIVWSCSKLIRAKQILSRKFIDAGLQKTLGLILPDIMKRQWDGKMATILQILQEREETKNATAIDLAVWMVTHDFE